MPIRFIPTGQLDITTDSTMLPEQAVGDKLVASDAMTVCTNLRLGHKGMARNRWGSSKVNVIAIDPNVTLMIEFEGHRYIFSGGNIYKDEVLIASGYADDPWSAIIYNQYNSELQSIFATNGTDIIRITGDEVTAWGVDAPTEAPYVNPSTVCTHKWERGYVTGCAQWGITAGNYQCSSGWEAAFVDAGVILVPTAPTATLQATEEGVCTPGTHLFAVTYETSNGETFLGATSIPVDVDDTHTKIDLADIPIGPASVRTRKVYMTRSDNVGAEVGIGTFLIGYVAGLTDVALTGVTSPIAFTDTISVNHPISGLTKYSIAAILIPWSGGTQTIRIVDGLIEDVIGGEAITATYATYWQAAFIDDNITTTLEIDIADADLLKSNEVLLYQTFNESNLATTLTDTDIYGVRYTYVRKEGDAVVFESSPSDAGSYTVATTAKYKPLLVFFKRPTDPQITHIRFYRTLDDAGVYYYDSEIGTKRGMAILSKTDAQLGDQVDLDHDRPPLGSMIIGPNYGGISFILKDNLAYYSLTGRPEYWPIDNYIEATTKDYPLVAGTFLDTQFYVGSKNDIFIVTLKDIGYTATVSGTTTTTVAAQRIDVKSMGANTGTHARQVFQGVKGHGLFHLGIDGLYQLTGSQYQPLYQGEGTDNNITNMNFRQLFEGETVGTIIGMNRDAIANCFLNVFKSKVFFAYPGLGSTYCDNMLVFGLIHKKVVHYKYPVAFRTAVVDHTNQRLLAADTEGFIWHIEDQSLTSDEGVNFNWYLQSKDFNLFKKMFPRTARYDVEVGNTAVGYILLNGVNKQTHTLTGDRRNRRRLIEGCTGDRLSIRLEGTGEVKIHKVEIE